MGKFFKRLFKGLAHLVALFFKIAYNILKWLKIRVLTLYLIVCGIVQLIFKVFQGDNIAWFWTGLVLCCFITVAAWIVYFSKRRRVKERKRLEDTPEQEEKAPEQPVQEEQKAPEPPPPPPPKAPPAEVKPHYFAVEGHKDYYFAEYADRYELYKRDAQGDFLVRTDYKRE